MHRLISSNSLQLEDFDIVNMNKWFPEMPIGVSVSQIYTQIAKYTGNVNKKQELQILSRCLSGFDTEEYMLEPKYVIMSVNEVDRCFGKQLKKLPKKTFINIKSICNENNEICKYVINNTHE